MKKFLNEIGTIIVAILAIFLGAIMIPLGFVYTVFKPFVDFKAKRFLNALKWFLKVLYQVWVVIKFIFLQIGYIIDLFGNVLVGELIEDFVTTEENTYFGKGDITISASFGDLLRRGKLNKTGLWFTRVLSKFDPKHENHCLAAIELYEYKLNKK